MELKSGRISCVLMELKIGRIPIKKLEELQYGVCAVGPA